MSCSMRIMTAASLLAFALAGPALAQGAAGSGAQSTSSANQPVVGAPTPQQSLDNNINGLRAPPASPAATGMGLGATYGEPLRPSTPTPARTPAPAPLRK